MKKIRFIFLALLVSASILGCKNTVVPKQKAEKETTPVNTETTYVSFNIIDGTNSRTAVPSFVWNDFKYSLTITEVTTKTTVTTPEHKDFTYYETGKYPLTPAVYDITLTGYDKTNDTPVIEGTVKNLDLRDGAKTATFRMKPVKQAKGSAKVTVTFEELPAGSSVYFKLSSSAVSDETGLGTAYTLNAENKVIYEKDNLNSGVTQYAIMHVHDANGKCLLTYPESLVIYPGLVSTSEITIGKDDLLNYAVSIDVNKNGTAWEGVTKTISLKDSSDNTYELSQNTNTYKGSIPQGTYTVYADGVSTGISFNSVDKTAVIDYYTVTFNPGTNVNLATVGAYESAGEKSYVVLKNTTFNYTVDFNSGYKRSSSFAVDGDTTVKDSYSSAITAEKQISTSDAEVEVYSISYDFTSGGSFVGGYSAPSSYTVENYDTVVLPVYSNVSAPNGKDLDGWSVDGNLFARIPSGTTGNLTLTPKWKEGVQIGGSNSELLTEEEKEAGASGVIFASGYNLIIKWDDSVTKTYVYYDYDGDGKINGNDKQVSIDGVTDFSNYVLRASDFQGKAPASDFTFNVQGGKIASLVGLGAEKDNKSTVNISGNCIIGDGSTIGIDLPSLTNECVYINGQMTGDYSITLMSGKQFDSQSTEPAKIADIANSSYAQVSKFKCLTKEKDATSGTRKELKIGYMNQGSGTIIYLANPDPIALPSKEQTTGGIVWLDDLKTQFKLGDTASVAEQCSVFSLSVENGTFQLMDDSLTEDNKVKLYNDEKDLIPTDVLGRIGESTYAKTLNKTDEYTYIHLFSKQNLITPAAVTDFIKTVKFNKVDTNTDITLKINLETVPYDDIVKMTAASTKYAGTTAFDYYDGSFYLGINKGARIAWNEAYDEAKQKKFNGLDGYLITITSSVENNYIYSQMKLGEAWTGGSRMINNGQTFDASTFKYIVKYSGSVKDWNASKGREDEISPYYKFDRYTKFYWQCGPEAGTVFWGSEKRDGHPQGYYGEYTNWLSTDEPNNYLKSSSGVPEDCMHLKSTGEWNDYKHFDANVNCYIVEFRPYETQYGVQKSNYPAVHAEVSY